MIQLSYGLSYEPKVRIVEDATLVDTVEDWSRVRSPARARRRRKRGFRQNITFRSVPKTDCYLIDGGRTLVIHPETAREIERQLEARMSKMMADAIIGRSSR